MYYLVYGLLYFFSLLPFWFLYVISDAIYFFLYYIFGYRKEVVMQNLLIAFPEKTFNERKKIVKDFYRNFIDNFIETLKLLSVSREELNKRFTGNYEVVNKLYDTGKKVQVHLAHFFNWEYANAVCAMNFKYPLITIYMPIKNKIFDKLFLKMRERFGAILIPATEYGKKFQAYAKTQYCLALVADQNAGALNKAYWADFFGKKIPFVKGPEKGAKLNNTAVVMCSLKKIKRGYYNCEFSLLTTEPRSLPEGEITKKMIAFIEDSIRKNPSNYLWSHRRWRWQFDEKKYGHLVI
ncbi:MAG: lysophospholipid acyltransferase family protein [Chitinophagaceae bacterium]